MTGRITRRRWTHADAQRVFAIREEMRRCGKARLHWEHNLRHPDRPLSLAAVGRIVRWGLESRRINPEGIGEANPCSFWCEGRARAKRKRDFSDGHAEAFSRATAGTAKAFLAEAPKRLGEQPIQVDGGSEFRANFKVSDPPSPPLERRTDPMQAIG